MNAALWIAIYMPMFVLFFIILPQQRSVRRLFVLKNRKRKGAIIMTNEIIKKYIGKECIISTGTFGSNAVGKIITVSEKWIEVETKKGIELINSEYVQSIKVLLK